jgi:hypothetical protein
VLKFDNRTKMQELFSEFGVHSENELNDKLICESFTIPCIICKKEFLYDELVFIEGDPYCKFHKDCA